MAIIFNSCRRCGDGPYCPGRGIVADPNRRWWQFWRFVTCPACGGDGMAKPPGWPDPAEIERRRPKFVGSPAHTGVKPSTSWPPPPRRG